MIISPAFNRDYRSKDEVLCDFFANKNFVVADINSRYTGSYVNKSDLEKFGEYDVYIRYDKLTKKIRVKKW